jgi:hypothetical protein
MCPTVTSKKVGILYIFLPVSSMLIILKLKFPTIPHTTAGIKHDAIKPLYWVSMLTGTYWHLFTM